MSDNSPIIKEVTLEQPIRRGELVIDTVRVRKPQAGELRGLSLQDLGRSDVNALLTLIPRISDPALVDHEVNAMAPEDLTAFGEKIFDFFLTSAQRSQIATILGG